MEIIHFPPTQDSPEIILNKDRGIFKISGNSFSEDPFTIYGRVLTWLKEYARNPNEQTLFEFQLNYINTASSKQIVEILKILEELTSKNKVQILWYYDSEDEDTMNEGMELSKMFQIDFDFLEE